MNHQTLLHGVRYLRNESATDYIARKEHEQFRKIHERKKLRKQFWREFKKTHQEAK